MIGKAVGAGFALGVGSILLWPQVVAARPSWVLVATGFALSFAGLVAVSDLQAERR